LASEKYIVNLIVPHNKRETIKGVNIIPLTQYRNRLLRFILGSVEVSVKTIKSKAKVVHFHDPELMFVGVLLSISGKKVFYDVHEDLPKQILYKPWLKSAFIKNLLSISIKITEQLCALFFTKIICATPDIGKKFNPSKTIVVRNFALLSLIDNAPVFDYNNNKINLVYVGGLTRIRGIKELIVVSESFENKIQINLLGQWEESYYEECKTLKGYNNVKYFGLIPLDEVFKYIKGAHIGISLLSPTKNHLTSLPVKAFEYMACGKPILMSDFPYWKETFSSCASFVNPANNAEIIEQLNELMNNPEKCNELGKAGRVLIENEYSWEAESKRLIQLYQNLFA